MAYELRITSNISTGSVDASVHGTDEQARSIAQVGAVWNNRLTRSGVFDTIAAARREAGRIAGKAASVSSHEMPCGVGRVVTFRG